VNAVGAEAGRLFVLAGTNEFKTERVMLDANVYSRFSAVQQKGMENETVNSSEMDPASVLPTPIQLVHSDSFAKLPFLFLFGQKSGSKPTTF
jgi:hypothetical protein